MADLFTKAEYKTYANVSSGGLDSRVDLLIPMVSDLVKTYCGRTFKDYYTTYKTEYHNGAGSVYVDLVEAPIRDIKEVWIRSTAISTKATIEQNMANSENYTLLSPGTSVCTNGTYTTEDTCINNDTFTGTLDDLTISGFNTNTSAGEVGRSYKVVIDGTSPDTFKWSYGDSNWLQTGVACSTSYTTLEGDIKVKFGATTGHAASDTWNFTSEIWTGSCSGTGIYTEADCVGTVGQYWTAPTEYVINYQEDRVERINPSTGTTTAFPTAPNAVKITYRGGYATTPADLKVAVMDLLTYYLKNESVPRKASGSITMEYITDSSFPPHIKRVLDLYRVVA